MRHLLACRRRGLGSRKPKPVARGIVAKELGTIVYFVLKRGKPYDGTFKAQPIGRTQKAEWPRKRSPDA